VGARRDRFSTIEKRRCDCAGGRAQAASVSASDGAPAQAICRPCDSAPTDACTQIDAGDRRDRFSTIEKRRCDCAIGRAQSASVSASDGAPAQAVCRLARFGKLALQLVPAHAYHECNSYLCTLMTSQTVRDSSKDCSHGQFGRLTRECRARATCRVHTRTRSGTSTSCNESRPLALRDEETAERRLGTRRNK
jgi:hypothetical protein